MLTICPVTAARPARYPGEVPLPASRAALATHVGLDRSAGEDGAEGSAIYG